MVFPFIFKSKHYVLININSLNMIWSMFSKVKKTQLANKQAKSLQNFIKARHALI